MRDFIETLREAWLNRRSIWKDVRRDVSDVPARYAQTDRGTRMTLFAFVAIFVVILGLQLL